MQTETIELETGEPKPEFHIDSEESANWYLRRLATIEGEKARVTAQAALIVKQLAADAEGLRYIYEPELQEFVRQELAKKGNRRKSLAFLQGTACFRTVPAGVKITDPDAALEFARRNMPAAVNMIETLDGEAYRKFAEKMRAGGAETLPDGVEATPERESFSVKFGKSEITE